MNLAGKTILITGASSGIGCELAKQLAKENCNLILLARRKEILDSLAQEIKTESNSVFTYKCDIKNKSGVRNTFDDLRKKLNYVDIGILNSAVNNRMSTESFNSELADETFQVNVLGMIYCIEELLKDFLPRKSGTIVGVSSIADVRGFPKSGLYGSSKAAVSTFLESLRIELKAKNIKVITVRPGFIITPMTSQNNFKMPFLMNVTKAAEIIINGIKTEKNIIEFPVGTVLGAKILKLLPNLIFDYLASKGLPQAKSKT